MSAALYDRITEAYAAHRRPDARLAAKIAAAVGPCRSVLNVGAGIGAYEPIAGAVVAVEPSLQMIRRRPRGSGPAVQAMAGRLPFADQSFDAALAILTVHHWPDWRAGLAELKRVARDRVVIVTWDPAHRGFWLVEDYLPEIWNIDQRIFPSMQAIERALGPLAVETLAVPADCADGFLGAYWRRPSEYLKTSVRDAISSFSMIDWAEGIARLQRDLESGRWHERNRALLALSELDIGYRLIVARGAPATAG